MSNEEYTITATPLPWEWDENSVNVIFDGQYYLKLSQGKVRLGANGATVNIIAETNYDADPNTGYPVGALLNKDGDGYVGYGNDGYSYGFGDGAYL